MPEGDCAEILEHGFQKGSGRVGRSQILEDNLKVQLAVNAHIRHRLTQYDSLMVTNKGQDAKLKARETVYSQVQAIAGSWRATSSQTSISKPHSSVPKNAAAILEANRQRRTRQIMAQTSPAYEAHVLENALGELRLNEDQREAGARAVALATCGLARKHAQRVARGAVADRELLRQYKLDPSIPITNRRRNEVLRLLTMNETQDPNPKRRTKRDNKEELSITAKSVELEPREIDRCVPENASSDDQPYKPHLLRNKDRLPENTHTYIGSLARTPGDGLPLGARGHDSYVPIYAPKSNIDTARWSRYPLRSSRRTTTDNGPANPNIETPRQSRYSLRSSHKATGSIHTTNDNVLSPTEESTSEGRLLVEDSDRMDIDDISSRTAGVHLA